MKKSINISRLLLALSLTAGLAFGADAQRPRGNSGGNPDRAGTPSTPQRTFGNADRSSIPRTERQSEIRNIDRSREFNRTITPDRPVIGQPQTGRVFGSDRNTRIESTPQRVDRTPAPGGFGNNNQATGRGSVSERTYQNGRIDQRAARGDQNRNSNYGNRGGYNNQRHYNYRSYEPRRYVYVGAPRYSILPRTSIHIQFGGYPYYYDNGLFYNYYGGFYQPVYAPFGIRVRVLPFGYIPIYMGSMPYYYYNGTYYKPDNDEYQVVDAPMGAQVSAMPKGTKAVQVNGEKFYEFNGTYYREDRNNKGDVVYTVVGKNGSIENTDAPQPPLSAFREGDVVSQLPEGSRTVTINGQQLFVSPDDIYFQLQVNGKITSYRVVGVSTDASPVSQQQL